MAMAAVRTASPGSIAEQTSVEAKKQSDKITHCSAVCSQIVSNPAMLLTGNSTNEHGEQLTGLNPPIDLRSIERTLA